jgi:hypothetical protein
LSRLLYFAYGSNLHPLRMAQRVPSASPLGRGQLRSHRLALHKCGRDGSGKCDAFRTGQPKDLVLGGVYRIARRDLPALDREEDLGRGYDRLSLPVFLRGRRRMVLTYLARSEAVRPGLGPLDWYLGYVVEGARRWRLPGRYVRRIAAEHALRDPVVPRRLRNRGIMSRAARPLPRR